MLVNDRKVTTKFLSRPNYAIGQVHNELSFILFIIDFQIGIDLNGNSYSHGNKILPFLYYVSVGVILVKTNIIRSLTFLDAYGMSGNIIFGRF